MADAYAVFRYNGAWKAIPISLGQALKDYAARVGTSGDSSVEALCAAVENEAEREADES